MLKQVILLSSLLLASAVVPPTSSLIKTAEARNAYTEVNRIPALLGITQNSWIQTTGLASGKMKFSQLSGTLMQIHQDITLTKVGRTAVEQVVNLTGHNLSGKSNTVAFRFEVKQLPSGQFEYSLFDRGNHQMLLNGPVKVLLGKNNPTHQELEFKAPIVKMNVIIDQGKSMSGKAKFSIGVLPVPGSLNFTKYSP